MGGGHDDLDARLAGLASERAEAMRLRAELAQLDEAAMRHQHAAARLGRDAERAAERLAALDGFGPIRWLRRVLGRDVAERAAATAELEAARRAHVDVEAQLERCDVRQKQLAERLEPVRAAELGWRELVDEKARRLAVDPEHGARLAAATRELEALAGERDGLAATVRHGRAAEAELLAARQQLRTARGGGAIDVLGGGPLAGMQKHRSLASVRGHVDAAVRHLRELRASTGLLERSLELVELGPATRVVDVVADNLAVDLFVQSRIREADSRVQEALDRVRQVVWQAERRGKEVAKLFDESSAARDAWIVAAR